jgi:putative sugar O-methyltransferase
MAYHRGRLGPAIRDRMKPYIVGSRLLFTKAHSNISLHCPDYIEPNPTDSALIRRIFLAYHRMKAAQSSASTLYRPAPFWAQIIQRYPVATLEQMRFFLSNFGTWKFDIGLDSSSLLHRLSRLFITKRYCEHVIFGNQLKVWRAGGNSKPLACLSYPRHGNQAGAFIDGHFAGVGSFDKETYGTLLANLIDNKPRPVIAELGAGYGKLAYFVLRHLPRFSFVDFDLPETLSIAAYYLMKAFPEKRALLYGETGYDPNCHQNYDLIFMPSWEIANLPNAGVDLSMNTNSLGEMDRSAAINYVSHLAGASRRFFHLNHELHPQTGNGPGLPASEYPMPSGFRLAWKRKDIWNEVFQGPDSDLFVYLYER